MKKILAIILATSSFTAFADTFQDFNNNLYAQYTYNNYHTNGSNDSLYTNGYGIGGTFQSNNNIWANVGISNNVIGGTGGDATFSPISVRAGYAFQFFGDDDSGFQVIPYASFGATDSANYTWGLGVQPEYRLLSSLKVSLGLGLFGYNGNPNNLTQTGLNLRNVDINGGNNCGCATVFAFNANPEVQYDIAKTIMLSAGYNFSTPFNAQNSVSLNAFTAKVGYLF